MKTGIRRTAAPHTTVECSGETKCERWLRLSRCPSLLQSSFESHPAENSARIKHAELLRVRGNSKRRRFLCILLVGTETDFEHARDAKWHVLDVQRYGEEVKGADFERPHPTYESADPIPAENRTRSLNEERS
jgi:hypothetical protein